jgi:hypothetical protein
MARSVHRNYYINMCIAWNRIGDVMVIVVASSAVDRMVESRCQDKLFAVSPLGTQH